MTQYISVKLPKSLADEIDKVLRNSSLGYSSRAEVVKDAVRDLLSKIKQEEA
jgi:metal-responsive CopG/Arc/MetJ family transcriptional regulator